MNTRDILLGAAAILCLVVPSSAQIAPQGQQAPQPRTQLPRPDTTAEAVTGCLYQEDSIPGRSPNVAEKAGVLEDYILTDATLSKEQNRLPDRPIADGKPPAPSAGSAGGHMYKVTKIDDEQLKALVGKRVEVSGTVKPDHDAKPADRATHTQLPNIEGTSIREVAGASCPAIPH